MPACCLGAVAAWAAWALGRGGGHDGSKMHQRPCGEIFVRFNPARAQPHCPLSLPFDHRVELVNAIVNAVTHCERYNKIYGTIVNAIPSGVGNPCPPPPPFPRTNRTSLVPPLVLSRHAASLTPYMRCRAELRDLPQAVAGRDKDH